MKKMPFARLICLGLLVCFSNPGLARSRVADSQVRLVGDLPCFAIGDQLEAGGSPFEVLGLILYDTRSRPPKKIWSLRSSAKAPVHLTPDQCLVYGEVPNGMIASGKALALERDVIYRVYINSRPKNPRSPTRGYTKSFCLTDGAYKQITIKEIAWDRVNKRWRNEVCDAAHMA